MDVRSVVQAVSVERRQNKHYRGLRRTDKRDGAILRPQLFWLITSTAYKRPLLTKGLFSSLSDNHNACSMRYTFLSFISLTWVIKNLLIITFLCVECEKYYSAIKQVESTCSQMITSERSSANQRRFCKNIVRVQGATFNKLRVCGLFAVDASLPLRVCAFITTYTIVLLQFVFLITRGTELYNLHSSVPLALLNDRPF
uniref:SFRICE_022148 n=1 Tax=Spodoptera frugiperda TaxID=7108 RepID=A0A2H1WBH6_SPOFR